MTSYRDLDVYKRSYRLALEVHQLSLSLPRETQYDLADQIRRCSRSIPSNIAEGYGRGKSTKDIITFVRTALGSNDEVLFDLEFLKDTELITSQQYQNLYDEYHICGKQLTQLIKHLHTSD
ncbi:MAG: four helix bundle protein [Patescibacteria group bacterium]